MNLVTRRSALLGSLAGLAAMSSLAARAASDPARKRSCILLWMAGGPSQMDTFDLKPGTENGGPFKEIATSVPGVRFSEHLPKLAEQAQHLAIIRSLQTKEGDHGRATAHLRTGYVQQGPIRFPSLGSLVSHERLDPAADLPGFVSVGPQGAFALPSVAAGYLGPNHAPVVVGRGGGIRGGITFGRTTADGLKVEERPVHVPDLMATIFTALGLDPQKQNPSNVGRPIRLADPDWLPLREILI